MSEKFNFILIDSCINRFNKTKPSLINVQDLGKGAIKYVTYPIDFGSGVWYNKEVSSELTGDENRQEVRDNSSLKVAE